MIRQQQVGWIGVVNNSDYLVTQTARSRELFILLFTFGTLALSSSDTSWRAISPTHC